MFLVILCKVKMISLKEIKNHVWLNNHNNGYAFKNTETCI